MKDYQIHLLDEFLAGRQSRGIVAILPALAEA
jgi:hypothetical protein